MNLHLTEFPRQDGQRQSPKHRVWIRTEPKAYNNGIVILVSISPSCMALTNDMPCSSGEVYECIFY